MIRSNVALELVSTNGSKESNPATAIFISNYSSVAVCSNFWFDDRLSNKHAVSNSSRLDALMMAFSLPTNEPLAEQIIVLSGASENIRKDPLWTLEDNDEYLSAKAQEVANAWRDQPSSTYEDALAQTQRIATR